MIDLAEQIRRYAESVSERAAIGPDPSESPSDGAGATPRASSSTRRHRRWWATAAAVVLGLVVTTAIVLRLDGDDLDVSSVASDPTSVTGSSVVTDSSIVTETSVVSGVVDEDGSSSTAPGAVDPAPTDGGGPAGSSTTTTVAETTQDDWCAAVEAFRSSGTIGADGVMGPEALPYLERIRDAGPADTRPPIETIIAWIQQGATMPPPAEVQAAQSRTTTDWINRCSSGSATQSPPPRQPAPSDG